jgi:hypothetical protein
MIRGDGLVGLLKLHHDLIGLVGDWKPYLDTRSCRNTTIRVSFGGRWRGDTLSGTHTTVEVSGLVGSGRTTNGFTSLDRLVTQHRPTQKRKSQTTARLLDTRDHGDGGIMKGREAVCHDGTGRIAWMGGRHVSLLYPDWLAVFAPSLNPGLHQNTRRSPQPFILFS